MGGEERKTVVADLRLSVFLRPLHPEFFEIRARNDFHQAAFDAEVWLLDPGHVITFVCGEKAITEAVAPRDLELPKRALVRQVDLAAGAGEERLEMRGPIAYTVAYQVDAEQPETYRLEAEELLAGARQGHLFSERPGDLAQRVFAYAVPELRARSFLVHTWHGFPAENTILKTQTLIERAES
jgi:hypothetical protein